MQPKLMVIGGTKRAIPTLLSILDRSDVTVNFAIFMEGYSDEKHFCDQLCEIAKKGHIPFKVTDNLDEDDIQKIKERTLDALIGIGVWRAMLPPPILEVSRFGYLGVHGSPLPAYRGFAGIPWQIINGESKLGMRAFRLGEGVDDGPLIVNKNQKFLEAWIDLENDKHLNEILEEYDEHHINLTNQIISLIVSREIAFKPQDETQATYACSRGPSDAEIDWTASTKNVFNLIRAQSNPLHGAYTQYDGEIVRIWRAKPRHDFSNYVGRIPGRVVSRDLTNGNCIILTQDSAIEVLSTSKGEGDKACRPVEIFKSVRRSCKKF